MAEIDWLHAGIDAAFAEARASARPLFLYWGASWCPPCNRLRASILNRPDVVTLSRSCVCLQVDGDSAGAQQLAERLKLRSYPTLVVYRPDGAEVTRLPCELDGESFAAIFALALHARFTVAESLSVALSRERLLSDDEWRLLSCYSWDTDEQQLLKNLDFAAIVASMTRACTLPQACVRLDWLALHAAAISGKNGIDREAAIARLAATLSDPKAMRAQFDIVLGYAVELVRFLSIPGSAARTRLVALWSSALESLEADAALGVADRLAALRTRVRLSRLGAPTAQLGKLAAARVASAAREVQDGALRHAVINTGAGILADACLLEQAEQLLQAELTRSHAPYYFMHNLAAVAKQRGDSPRALDWYEQAWRGAIGPATRLQWGASYLQGLVDFAPHDSARLERLAEALLEQLAAMPDQFFQRNLSQLRLIDARLSLVDGLGPHASALRQAARAAPSADSGL